MLSPFSSGYFNLYINDITRMRGLQDNEQNQKGLQCGQFYFFEIYNRLSWHFVS